MIFRGLTVWVLALGLGISPTAAFACGQEAADATAAARDWELRTTRKVKGSFRIESVEILSEGTEERSELRKIHGVITGKSGKIWNTVHLDDDYIILCSKFYQPSRDIDGRFFLKRRKDGRYDLIHYNWHSN